MGILNTRLATHEMPAFDVLNYVLNFLIRVNIYIYKGIVLHV
jgi:hypothetical protein